MEQIRSIHYLRAVAALMVVVFHTCNVPIPGVKPEAVPFHWLQSGVDVFFVISGFVMVESTRGRDHTATTFLIRRLIRIVPLYWLMTLLMYRFASEGVRALLWPSLFFIPVHHPESHIVGIMEPILQPGWTLNLEMFFYVLFAALISLSARRQLVWMFALFVALITAGSIYRGSPTLTFYSNTIMLEFWLGMALAHFRHHARAWMLPLGLALLALPPIGYAEPRLLRFGVGAFLFVAGALACERRLPTWTWAVRLGDASYAIYLVHMFVVFAMVAFASAIAATSPALFIALTAVFACLAGLLVHRTIEKPITETLNALFVRRTEAMRNTAKASSA